MDRKAYLAKIANEFEDWWIQDPHSSNMDFYRDTITSTHLAYLSDEDFVDFFYEFVSKGGRVQSGGDRTKNRFRNTVEGDFGGFKEFVLKPFQANFSLQDWFMQLEHYPGFGVGIATIFLNRIDYDKYPIMNNKTLKALNRLGYRISSSKNWVNYELVKRYQDRLIDDFPMLQNYFKTDALNHFIVAVYQGKELVLQIEAFENWLEQHDIEHRIKVDSGDINKDDLYKKIIECENDKSEEITVKSKIYKRHNYLMVQIKKYRDYKCQFCSTTILKANGDCYIEACHIKPKAEGGKDSLNNILILCPNCHKLFDYGKREKEKISEDAYSVIINEKTYKASLK